MTPTEILSSIKPGKNYPGSVTVTETIEGNTEVVRFLLQSYVCGMYCAIHTQQDPIPFQAGDHNNKGFVQKLKRDITRAIERGAKVEFGTILPIQVLESSPTIPQPVSPVFG